MSNLSLTCCNETSLVLQTWIKGEIIAFHITAIFYISFCLFLSFSQNHLRYSCLYASAMLYPFFSTLWSVLLNSFVIYRNHCIAKFVLYKCTGLWIARRFSCILDRNAWINKSENLDFSISWWQVPMNLILLFLKIEIHPIMPTILEWAYTQECA